jgi:hypothetical protein
MEFAEDAPMKPPEANSCKPLGGFPDLRFIKYQKGGGSVMEKTRKVTITVVIVLSLGLCFTASLVVIPGNVQANGVPLPTVTGPIPETSTSRAFDPAAGTNYQSMGYLQEEYFISGWANEYDLADPDDTSSFAVVVRMPNLPYKTRILVRRPAEPSLFSGNVIVEFLNPSGGYDIATAWEAYWNYIIPNGDVWVGVTCKNTILYNLAPWPQGLKVFDPVRYATLSFDRDRAQAWDIFTQLGALLKSSDPSNPLVADGFSLTNVKLYGHGYSQTGGYLITYINFFHSLAKLDNGQPIYDGYLANSAGGPIWINDDYSDPSTPSMGFGPYPPTDPRRVIQPCGVPVMHTLTETEIAMPDPFLNALPTRRPDSDVYPDLFRHYEIPGACHMSAESFAAGPTNADIQKTLGYVCPFCCTGTLSDFPSHYIFDGTLANIEEWVRTGTLPPKGDLIQLTSGGVIARDAFGNAKGGIRTPYVDVPIKTYLPMSPPCPTCPPESLCAGCSFWCVILGNITPFDQATLKGLYKNHGGYVSKFVKSTQQLFKSGWITEAEMELMKTGAAESHVPK